MDGLRIVVSAISDVERAGLAARLDGTGIELCEHLPTIGDHAAAFVGTASLDRAVLERLLKSGTHILVAAESVLPAPDLESLADLAREAGVCFHAVNPDRYLPSIRLIQQQLPRTLGEVGMLRIHRWEPPTVRAESALPAPLLRDLDIAVWLAGRRPNRVYAVERSSYFQVHLGYADGGSAILAYSNAMPAGDGYRLLSVIGSSGAAYIDDQANAQLVYQGGSPRALRSPEDRAQLAAIIKDFAELIRTGTAAAADWRDAYAAASAIHHSLSTKRAVPVGEG